MCRAKPAGHGMREAANLTSWSVIFPCPKLHPAARQARARVPGNGPPIRHPCGLHTRFSMPQYAPNPGAVRSPAVVILFPGVDRFRPIYRNQGEESCACPARPGDPCRNVLETTCYVFPSHLLPSFISAQAEIESFPPPGPQGFEPKIRGNPNPAVRNVSRQIYRFTSG